MDKTISSAYFKQLTKNEKTMNDLVLWLTQELENLEDMEELDWSEYLDGSRDAYSSVLDMVLEGRKK